MKQNKQVTASRALSKMLIDYSVSGFCKQIQKQAGKIWGCLEAIPVTVPLGSVQFRLFRDLDNIKCNKMIADGRKRDA